MLIFLTNATLENKKKVINNFKTLVDWMKKAAYVENKIYLNDKLLILTHNLIVNANPF